MSWDSIKADAKDTIDAVKGGMGIHRAIKEYHREGAAAVFYCGICALKTTIALKHLLERHFAGQMPTLPHRCEDPACRGHLSYQGIE